MGASRRLILGVLALLLMASTAYGLPKVSTTTVTSGQVPSATNWNTYLNYAENWINTNLLNGANTFTIPNGDSALVNGTLVVDSLRVTGFFDLATHILPRATRTYRIGLPTRLVWALHADTVRAAIADFDSLLGTTIFGSTPIGRPSADRTGVLGLPTFMWQAAHIDSIVAQNVTLDSLTVTSGIDSASIDNGGVSGSDMAGTLSGNKTWTGIQTFQDSITLQSDKRLKLNGGNTFFVQEAATATYVELYVGAVRSIRFQGGGNSTVELYVPTDGQSAFEHRENAAFRYNTGYDSANNRWFLQSGDSDGGGTDADIIRVPDGGVAINGNGAFVDNQFDYVCPTCGYHRLEGGSCPKDGRVLVWNDDVESIRESMRELKRNRNAQTILHKVGILTTDQDGWSGIAMNKASYFALSALVQQSDRITRENEVMQAQIDELKRERTGIPVMWVLVGIGIGVGVALFRRRADRILKTLPFLLFCIIVAGSAWAVELTFEQKALKGFKRGGYQISSVAALRDSIIAFSAADSAVAKNTYLDSLATEISRQQTIGYVYQGANKILLTNVGKAAADLVP